MIRKLVLKNTRTLQRYFALRNVKKVGCWFVDIPRTSSTSIRVELGRFYGLGFGKHCPFEEGKDQISALDSHLTAQDVKRQFGDDLWKKLFTFSFVRNPWDRFLSLYFFRKNRGQLNDLTFKEYARQLDAPRYKGRGLFSDPVYYYSMSDYLLDPDGNLLVDFVGRFENRTADLKVVADKLGIEFEGLHINETKDKKHYSEYYDEETRALVERVYQLDISFFGYAFEST
jgi:hypothetical protein